MAKRKAKQPEVGQEQTAPVEVEAPKVEAEVGISKTETTTAPQTYEQLVDKLVCSLNELAKGNYNREALVQQAKTLLLQYKSPVMESTIQYCFIEMEVQQPAELKWSLVINAIRDAVILAQK